ncbi:hypothetical protein, partial [Geobacillus stearothermophilus]|nr:hypothetical protein [Geobacillus stearothermophilus]MED3755851.1 hypothetical protein [Geobacillus stearothermophilus]
NTACCTVNMRFTSLSINIHIIDKERRKYSAHFMMWLNSYKNLTGSENVYIMGGNKEISNDILHVE